MPKKQTENWSDAQWVVKLLEKYFDRVFDYSQITEAAMKIAAAFRAEFERGQKAQLAAERAVDGGSSRTDIRKALADAVIAAMDGVGNPYRRASEKKPLLPERLEVPIWDQRHIAVIQAVMAVLKGE